MSELVEDCPRCGAKKITFDVIQGNIPKKPATWETRHELFSICRHCENATIFVARFKTELSFRTVNQAGGLLKYPNINQWMIIDGFVSEKDLNATPPPEHLPGDIRAAFEEGAKCLAIGCVNAAATMFRLCIDLSTRKMLPETDEDGLNQHIRRTLGKRLGWLFDTRRLPDELRDLSNAVKEDGNDGAHEGTLTKPDTEDLLDFTMRLLERLYTEPARIRLAQERRLERRSTQPARASGT